DVAVLRIQRPKPWAAGAEPSRRGRVPLHRMTCDIASCSIPRRVRWPVGHAELVPLIDERRPWKRELKHRRKARLRLAVATGEPAEVVVAENPRHASELGYRRQHPRKPLRRPGREHELEREYRIEVLEVQGQ